MRHVFQLSLDFYFIIFYFLRRSISWIQISLKQAQFNPLTFFNIKLTNITRIPHTKYFILWYDPRQNSGWLSLDSSLSIDMCQQWRKIFVYPTSDPDRNTFGDMSDLTLCRSYITHDSSKHFESIIILNHAYVWSIESHGWPKTFVSHSGLQYTNTFGDMRRQRSSRVDQTPFLPPVQRRYNGGKNAGTTALQRRYNAGTTATRPRELHFENLISYVPMYRT